MRLQQCRHAKFHLQNSKPKSGAVACHTDGSGPCPPSTDLLHIHSIMIINIARQTTNIRFSWEQRQLNKHLPHKLLRWQIHRSYSKLSYTVREMPQRLWTLVVFITRQDDILTPITWGVNNFHGADITSQRWEQDSETNCFDLLMLQIGGENTVR